MVGRSGCGRSINMKYMGEGTNAAKNSGVFPACRAVIMLKIEATSVCTRTRSCSSAPATNKSKKKITSKLELGLNFAVNVDLWVCNDDFHKKKLTVIFVLVQMQILIFLRLLGISI